MKLSYLCPVCRGKLKQHENAFRCPKGHSFDISRKGYVNLLTTKGHNPDKAGDNKEMIRARSGFLDSGHYEPLARKVGTLIDDLTSDIKEPAVIDSGCGEGYYTVIYSQIAGRCELYGVDISKHGIDHAASRARSAAPKPDNVFFSVGSAFSLPFKDSTADIVISTFAPVSNDEYARVLKPGGRLIIVSPSARHLFGLKSVLYEKPYENEPNRYALSKFTLEDTVTLEYSVTLECSEQIMQLFTMTPYYYKTSKDAADRLRAVSRLETELGFEIRVYTKN